MALDRDVLLEECAVETPFPIEPCVNTVRSPGRTVRISRTGRRREWGGPDRGSLFAPRGLGKTARARTLPSRSSPCVNGPAINHQHDKARRLRGSSLPVFDGFVEWVRTGEGSAEPFGSIAVLPDRGLPAVHHAKSAGRARPSGRTLPMSRGPEARWVQVSRRSCPLCRRPLFRPSPARARLRGR